VLRCPRGFPIPVQREFFGRALPAAAHAEIAAAAEQKKDDDDDEDG
jgi:hypothetical protein